MRLVVQYASRVSNTTNGMFTSEDGPPVPIARLAKMWASKSALVRERCAIGDCHALGITHICSMGMIVKMRRSLSPASAVFATSLMRRAAQVVKRQSAKTVCEGSAAFLLGIKYDFISVRGLNASCSPTNSVICRLVSSKRHIRPSCTERR